MHFSTSTRVSTFLSTLSSHLVVVSHLPGYSNLTSGYSSRHPQQSHDNGCQICKFLHETAASVVNSVRVSDVLSSSSQMPFFNKTAWHSAEHDCPDLCRAYAHPTQGTLLSRKARNLKHLRRCLTLLSPAGGGIHPQPYFPLCRAKMVIGRKLKLSDF